MLLHNYVDFEHELLQISLRNALFSVGEWSELRSIIQDLNRRMVNLLSTARLYLDHLRHRSAPLLTSAGVESGVVNTIISHEYEARQGYRVMEALRNHVQHRGLPLHSITVGGKWVETSEGRRRDETSALYLKVDTLAEGKRFKRSILHELANRENKLPLKPLIRDYITGLIRIQQRVREELQSGLEEDDALLKLLVDDYRRESNGSVLGLAAVARTPDGTDRERVIISTNFADRRKWLERKNSGAGELTNLIVTSR